MLEPVVRAGLKRTGTAIVDLDSLGALRSFNIETLVLIQTSITDGSNWISLIGKQCLDKIVRRAYNIDQMTKETNRIIPESRWRLHRVIDKALILSRSPGDYGTGERLNLAEIRIIYTVGSNHGINITELSNEIGVGKSTVSAIVNRLYRKQYIKKLKEISNKKNILLELTEKGATARAGFERFHQDFIWRHAQDLTVEQYSAFNEVLRRVEEYLDSQLNGS